jgi:transcriptional regulator with XRE-family HTH domain
VAPASFRGTVLRAARSRVGLTQAELAERAGIADVGRISNWERGVDQPTPAVVPHLAEALGLNPAELYEAALGSFEVMRRAAGLSLMALAELTGLGYKRVRGIEKGLRVPTADDAARLASALDVSAARVLSAAQVAAATRNAAASAGP